MDAPKYRSTVTISKHCNGRFIVVVLLMFAADPFIVVADRLRPNIIVILTDDQGWGDLSLHGNTNLQTPHIDRLAAEGAQFERFFVCPVCSPTRAEFLTGRYHPRSGVYSTSAGGERIDRDETTIADCFHSAGYRTAVFGKWHNGMQYPYHPNARGFDEFYGFCSGHWGHYYSPLLEHNGEMCRGNGFLADDFTDHALRFIEEHRAAPFLVYLAYNTPHSPMQVPDKWWKPFADKPLDMRHRDPEKEDIVHTRAALAMCENIDWNVGRVLGKLKTLDLVNDTIVVFLCDNGPNGNRWNGGMKGRKGSTDEGGVRSPLLVRWPDRIAAGRHVSQIASVMDLFPTLADLADVTIKTEYPLDGMSLKPLLFDVVKSPDEVSDRWPDRILVSHWRDRVSLRTQRFRLDPRGSLFDMLADPEQRKDVAADHPDEKQRLVDFRKTWKKEVLAGYDTDERAFVVGHRDANLTQLPARDATTLGGIERSNRFPNCSYFRNWNSVEDTIIWDVEIGATGEYEVELYYACPEEDIGSTIELRCGDTWVSARVAVAHDPPLVGAEADRVKRMESYVKDFKPMKMGTLQLTEGWRGPLTLRATEIANTQAMEFRLLLLRRVE